MLVIERLDIFLKQTLNESITKEVMISNQNSSRNPSIKSKPDTNNHYTQLKSSMAIIKIFATGVTGYIGGDALTEIIHAYPDW